MSDQPRKTFDVVPPGQSPAPPTSRPVIAGYGAAYKDPMVQENVAQQVALPADTPDAPTHAVIDSTQDFQPVRASKNHRQMVMVWFMAIAALATVAVLLYSL